VVKKSSEVASAFVSRGAIWACDKAGGSGSKGESCSDDEDCKSGLVCKKKTCVAKKKGKKAKKSTADQSAKAGQSSPANEGSKVPTKPGCDPPTKVPAISGITARVDHGGKWHTACAINTAADKQPDNCTMVIRKEWIKVECKGDVQKIKKQKAPPGALFNKHYGVSYNDHVFGFKPGKDAWVYLRLFKGRSPKLWICFPDHSAELSVSWPKSAPKPQKVALIRGPACG